MSEFNSNKGLERFLILQWPSTSELTKLVLGLFCFGFGNGLFVASGLGHAPWVVFYQGQSLLLGGSIGLWAIIVSLLLLLSFIPLRERVGVATLVGALITGPSIDLATTLFPETKVLVLSLLYLFFGTLLSAFGTGLYLTQNLGPGPRDGIMMALGRRGVPIWIARSSMEATVLIGGMVLGGTAGIGTVVFVICVGPGVQFFMKRFGGKN